MIAVNATILIQMVHFLIAYSILRFILFKPLVARLHAQEEQTRMAHSRITAYQADVALQEEEKARRWQECQKALAKKMPTPGGEPIFHNLAPALSVNELHAPERKELVREISSQLIKKVDHAS